MPQPDANKPVQRSPVAPGWFRPPAVIALLLGGLLGLLFGTIAGNVREPIHGGGLWLPFGGLGGALLGLLGGLLFVSVGLLLYRAIRDAWTGALVLGLFAMLAMALVGGLFGAVIGLLTGALLGALVGGVKARGGLVVGYAPPPVRETTGPSWLGWRPRWKKGAARRD